MAQTADDLTTWPLLCDEHARVSELCKSAPTARELLHEYLAKGWIPWRCWQLEISGLLTTLSAARRFFWLRRPSVRHHIDWPNSRAIRTGPPMIRGDLNYQDLEPIREVWIYGEAFAAIRLSMMRIMARRMNAATVVA